MRPRTSTNIFVRTMTTPGQWQRVAGERPHEQRKALGTLRAKGELVQAEQRTSHFAGGRMDYMETEALPVRWHVYAGTFHALHDMTTPAPGEVLTVNGAQYTVVHVLAATRSVVCEPGRNEGPTWLAITRQLTSKAIPAQVDT